MLLGGLLVVQLVAGQLVAGQPVELPVAVRLVAVLVARLAAEPLVPVLLQPH